MLTRNTLVLSTLKHYWRSNLAMLAGIIIACAALTGALIVGDSIRGSLKQMTLDRLGRVDTAIDSPRFVTEELAGKIKVEQGVYADPSTAPVIHLSGAIKKTTAEGAVSRAGGVQVYGVDERFWKLIASKGMNQLSGFDKKIDNFIKQDAQSLVLNDVAFNMISGNYSDEVTVFLDLPGSIPRDTLFGEREETTAQIELKISGVFNPWVGDDRSKVTEPTDAIFFAGSGRVFSLRPDQTSGPIAYVPLKLLQERLGIQKLEASRRNPNPKPARVNALYSSGVITDVSQALSLADLQLRLVPNEARTILALESDQLILETTIARAAERVATENKLKTQPVLLYLANELANKNNLDKFAMYSTVAGIDLTAGEPFGPYITTDGQPVPKLTGNEVAINQWLAEDLGVSVGDVIRMKYHQVGSTGELPELEAEFTVKAILKMEAATLDRGVVPVIEGVTTADSFADWEQPFPMNLDRITSRDEEYWDEYKATPKLFMSVESAQKMWTSKYGDLTSIRFAHETTPEAIAKLERQILNAIDLPATGLAVQPVLAQGLKASAGSNDFSGLFLGFSFFLIGAALILTVLLFRLSIEERIRQLGLYAAVGLTTREIRTLLLKETLLLSLGGGVLGAAAAVAYADLMMTGLTTWWQGAVGTTNLHVYVTPMALITGPVVTLVMTMLVVWWSLRGIAKLSVREQLTGNLTPDVPAKTARYRGTISFWIGSSLLGIAVMLLVAALGGMLPQKEAFSGFNWTIVAFFQIGLCTLIGGILLLRWWLVRPATNAGAARFNLQRLSVLNTMRQPSRTLTTTSMIASATFLIVAVGVGQYNPLAVKPDKTSGNGGFSLVAESSRPILANLESLDLNQALAECKASTPGAEPAATPPSAIEGVRIYSFPVKSGENASCLNLYQTTVPTILGVSEEFIQRGGFAFADTPGENPWTRLHEETPNGDVPALGDMNTLMYSLHKMQGDTIELPMSNVPKAKIQIAGMLTGSVFQGVLLISEKNFRRLFPEVVGYQYFLVETNSNPGCVPLASQLLETRYEEFGLDAEPVADRLARFLAVQNTYLTTFQTLGGLGLLLGTIGLGVVMLRNVLERRGEIALLRSIGLTGSRIGWMVFLENSFMLLVGIGLGTIAAQLAMWPHLQSSAAQVPWLSLGGLLVSVLLVGSLGGLFAVWRAMRLPIVTTLRGE